MSDIDFVFDIENELKTPTFYNIQVGNTLGDVLYTEIRMGNGKWNLLDMAKNILRILYHWLIPPVRNEINYKGANNKILFTWQDERANLKDLVVPVINQFEPEQCIVIGKSLSMKKYLSRVSFFTWEQTPPLNFWKWHKEFIRCFIPWTKKIYFLTNKNHLPFAIVPRLLDAIVVQTQKIVMFNDFLDQIRPIALVTEYDRNFNASCLVLTAKTKKIPTMTMIHGVINPPYGYTPLLADKAFCWGEQHRQQLIKMGCDADSLVITGCQRLSQSLRINRNDALKKSGLPLEKTIVLFASNPININFRRKLVQDFCLSFSNHEEFLGIVRLHPSEKLFFYEKEIKMFPSIRFLDNTDWTLDEAIAASDVIIIHESGFGNEALAKGRPVVIFNPLSIPLSNSRELVEIAGCPLALDSKELFDAVHNISHQETIRTELNFKAQKYVEYFCKYFGDTATGNIVSQIQSQIHVTGKIT